MLADTNMKVVLEIPFFSLSNANIEFAKLEKQTQRSYIVAEVLPTTSRIEHIEKREFVKVALNENSETFLMYVTALEVMLIHPS